MFDTHEQSFFPPASSGSGVLHDLPRLIERMHRRFLDVVRIELTRQGINDISPVQAMMLANIGDEEISVRDLIERGYYLGSNASYNLKHLVEGGYVTGRRRNATAAPRGSKLSAKGRTILDALTKLNTQMAEPLLNRKPIPAISKSPIAPCAALSAAGPNSVRFAGARMRLIFKRLREVP